MNKVAVLGDGILGKELCKQKNFKCFSRRKGNFNIYEIESLSKIIVDHDIIINCIANTDSYSQDFKSHWEVNYVFVKNLVALINKHNKKLIHISTEFVYSMNSGNPSEVDEPIPNLSYYSMSKLFADKYIVLNSNNYLICRSLHKKKDLVYDEVWDIMTTGDTVDLISALILKLISKNASGIFNVGTGYKHLSEIVSGKKTVDAPEYVPKSINMDLTKLNNFLNENN